MLSMYNAINQVTAEGFNPLRRNQSRWDNRVNPQLNQAISLTGRYLKNVLESANQGDKFATRIVENMMLGLTDLPKVIEQYPIDNQNHKHYLYAAGVVKESFLHTTSVFPEAVASCIELDLAAAWELCDPCWFNYVNIRSPRNGCREAGVLEVIALKKGVNNSKPIIEGDVTHTNWEVGESINKLACPRLYGDGLQWTWRLEQCLELPVLQEALGLITTAQDDGRTIKIIRLYAQDTGFNTDVFNPANSNILTDNPPPTIESINDAINLLQSQKSLDGRPLCNGRAMVFVTGNPAVANQIGQLITATETRFVDSNTDTVRIVQGSGVYSNITVCYEPLIQLVATEDSTQVAGQPIWETAWWLITAPDANQRNFIEHIPYTGFETPQLFAKAPNTTTLGGQVVAGMGDFYTMNREVKSMLGYGSSIIYPQLAVASLGDNTPTP